MSEQDLIKAINRLTCAACGASERVQLNNGFTTIADVEQLSGVVCSCRESTTIPVIVTNKPLSCITAINNKYAMRKHPKRPPLWAYRLDTELVALLVGITPRNM